MTDSAVARPPERTAPQIPVVPLGRAPRRLVDLAARGYWVWPALLTLGCGTWQLGVPSLWADELATWGAVRLGWRSLLHLMGGVDVVVAPYYLMLKAWTTVAGTSPVALRLPSLLAMTVATALVAILGNRLGTTRTGTVAGLIFAVVPSTSRYAQEARPYAFAILAAVLATLLLLRLLDRPTIGTAALYALAVALLGAFHIIGLLLLVAHAVAARHRLAYWAVAAGCGVLPVLPLAMLGQRQSHQLAWIPYTHLHVLLSAPDLIFEAAEVGGALVVLAVPALSRRPPALLLVCWAIAPLVILAVAGRFTPLFYARYLLYTVPAWVLLAAFTLERFPRRWVLAVVLAIGLLGVPAQLDIRTAAGHSTASSAAGAIIAAQQRPGDAIAYSMKETAIWEARDVVARYVPPARRPLDVFALTGQRVDGRLPAVECPDLAACLDRTAPDRLWMIRLKTQTDPLTGIGEPKETLLRSHFRLARLWLVRGLTLALYVRN
jgi:mannosyltransferase